MVKNRAKSAYLDFSLRSVQSVDRSVLLSLASLEVIGRPIETFGINSDSKRF